MQVKDQIIRSLIVAAGSGVLLSGASDGAAAQSKKAPPRKTTTTPIVTPTASEGTTATAIRGRPVSTAAGRAVNGALKSALANVNVRNNVRTEVLRQLRVRRPFAVISGYLVSAIDLAPVYQAAGVRPALLASLGVNGPQLIKDAAVSADRLMISFTTGALGQVLLPQFTADITRTLGVSALKSHIPDIGPIVMILVLAGSGLGLTISFAESLAAFLDWLGREDPPENPTGDTADFDGDGEMNMYDDDDDGDHVPDKEDNYPWDKDKSICDCGRPRAAISLTSIAAGDFLPPLVRALNATQAQKAKALSLGAIAQGQAATLALFF